MQLSDRRKKWSKDITVFTPFSSLILSADQTSSLLGFHENLTVGCRCMGFSNEQYQCDDGHHIRDHGNQVRGYHIALGCQGTDTTAKSEQQTRLGRALWRELAKDYCRNGDESLSYDNAGTELVDGCQCYECSAKSCQKSRQDHTGVTDLVYIDSQRLTCFRMLAHCS